MRPTEVDKIKSFRDALMKIYTVIGKGGNDKLWTGRELIKEFKGLFEYYDALFKDNITNNE